MCVIHNTYNATFYNLTYKPVWIVKVFMSAICQSLTFFILIIMILVILIIVFLIVIIRLWLTEDDEADSASAACIRTVSIVTGYWSYSSWWWWNHHSMMMMMLNTSLSFEHLLHRQCNYDLEGSQLYSVKWYKNGQEFFRWEKGIKNNRQQLLPTWSSSLVL